MTSDTTQTHLLTLGTDSDARAIAVRVRQGVGPGLFWLGGFMSDMNGTKAVAVDQFAAEQGRACVRFDYSGHGASEKNKFKAGTIGRWLEESLAVFTTYCTGPQIVIGSSMGGWLALLLARALQQRQAKATIAALILIAPAVDFTEVLIADKLTPELKAQIQQQGFLLSDSEYSTEPYCITQRLLEEGRQHLLLDQPIVTNCPVRILQGLQDTDVPWEHVSALLPKLVSDDVVMTLIKDGNHTLSRPQDIARLLGLAQEFCQQSLRQQEELGWGRK